TEPATLRGLVAVIGGGGPKTAVVDSIQRELEEMELRVAMTLGFRLTVPTSLSFLGVYLRRASALGFLRGTMALQVENAATQILKRVLRDASSLSHTPSATAAAALCWACCATHSESMTGWAATVCDDPSGPMFEAVTGYVFDTLYSCLTDIEYVRAKSQGGRQTQG
ncbi:unnamed protein product, partial [Choristocarpus tenellus]